MWPAAGVALAGLLISGYKVWPGIFIGAVATNAYIAMNAGNTLLSSTGLITTTMIAMGATVQAVLAYYLVCRYVTIPLLLEREKILSVSCSLQDLSVVLCLHPSVSPPYGAWDSLHQTNTYQIGAVGG